MIVVERLHVGLDPVLSLLLGKWFTRKVMILKKLLNQHCSGLRTCARTQGFRLELGPTDLNK